MKVSRRVVLRGIGGLALGLPVLEGLQPRKALAQSQDPVSPFVIFFRQANGPATKAWDEWVQLDNELFFPRLPAATMAVDRHLYEGFSLRMTDKAYGQLGSDECSVRGRVLEGISAHLDDMLLVGGINMAHNTGECGHADGALQALTAAPVQRNGSCGRAGAGGESLDYRIQRTLAQQENHLYLFAGLKNGWLGGECVSHRGANQKLTATVSPFAAFERVVTDTVDAGGGSSGGGGSAGGGGLDEAIRRRLVNRENSVNDFLREQFAHLRRNRMLSLADLQRLEYHQSHIRDLEMAITDPQFICGDDPQQRQVLQGFNYAGQGRGPEDEAILPGEVVLETARYHMDVAALAVACGRNRAVTIQVGNGNDGLTAYRRPNGTRMENFHFVSHRIPSHGGVASDDEYPDVYIQHSEVDRLFASAFGHLVDQLKGYGVLQDGMAIWYNELGNGPFHASYDMPWVIAGGAKGQLQQGRYIQLDQQGRRSTGGFVPNHRQLLNTIGAAVGLKDSSGQPIRDFGRGAGSTEGHLGELLGQTALGSVA